MRGRDRAPAIARRCRRPRRSPRRPKQAREPRVVRRASSRCGRRRHPRCRRRSPPASARRGRGRRPHSRVAKSRSPCLRQIPAGRDRAAGDRNTRWSEWWDRVPGEHRRRRPADARAARTIRAARPQACLAGPARSDHRPRAADVRRSTLLNLSPGAATIEGFRTVQWSSRQSAGTWRNRRTAMVNELLAGRPAATPSRGTPARRPRRCGYPPPRTAW